MAHLSESVIFGALCFPGNEITADSLKYKRTFARQQRASEPARAASLRLWGRGAICSGRTTRTSVGDLWEPPIVGRLVGASCGDTVYPAYHALAAADLCDKTNKKGAKMQELLEVLQSFE